jgi:hypothetical protein
VRFDNPLARYPPGVLNAGLVFVVVLVAIWIFVVILGVALRFRHLLRRKHH